MPEDIRNCKPMFKFQCPMRWDLLQLTGQADIRYCPQCDQEVHYCKTDEEMIQHAEAGHCVARRMPGVPSSMETIVGDPVLLPDTSDEDAGVLVQDLIEEAKSLALKHVSSSRERCRQCGFPIAAGSEAKCAICRLNECLRSIVQDGGHGQRKESP